MKPTKLFLAAFAAALGLYLLFPSARYNYDGVACAIAVETGDLRHLVHGNHLAYGALGLIFDRGWRLLGYAGPAIVPLQVFSSILSAAGVGAFLLLLLEFGACVPVACLGAAALAVSKLYWLWALESQVYPLGALFLILAAANIKKKTKTAALCHAGAVLGHAGHVAFLPAALYMLPNHRARARYLLTLGAATAAAYALAAVLFLHPRSFEDVRVWLLGSAALRVDKSFQWLGGYSIPGMKIWLINSLQLFGDKAAGAVLWGVALWAIVCGLRGKGDPRKGLAPQRRLATFCALWLGAYAALFMSWQPHTPVYRITDVAALWLAIVALENRDRPQFPWKLGSVPIFSVLVLYLFSTNLVRFVVPGSKPENNPDLQRALWIARQTPENAWVVAEHLEQVYIPYFAHRKPLNLRYFFGRPEAFQASVKEFSRRGEPVYVVPQVLSAQWARWFQALRSRPVDQRGSETLLLLSPS